MKTVRKRASVLKWLTLAVVVTLHLLPCRCPAANQVITWHYDGSVQTNFATLLTNVVAVSAGEYHQLALNYDGTVFAWLTLSVYPDLTNVPADLTNAVAISAGVEHSLALRRDGTVVAWGSGELASVPEGLTNVIAIAAGRRLNVALKSDGTVTSWGPNGSALPLLSNVVAVAADEAGVALQADGSVIGFGRSHVTPPLWTNATAIAMGSWKEYALLDDSSVQVRSYEDVFKRITGFTNVGTISAQSYASIAGLTGEGEIIGRMGERINPTNLPAAVAVEQGTDFAVAIIGEPVSAQREGPPFLTRAIPSRAVVIGGTTQLIADAIGAEPLEYQWQFAAQDIPGATSSTLTLTNVQPSQAGDYSVTIRNALGARSRTASIVLVPAIIKQQPSDITTFRGDTVAWTVAVESSVPLSYQWQFNGVDIPGANSNTLKLANADFGNSGAYAVVISNTFGVLRSTTATLAVLNVAVWGATSPVPTQLTNVVDVDAGRAYFVALNADGTVVVWGDLIVWGNESVTNVPAGLSDVVQISAGEGHVLALKREGTVVAWGDTALSAVPQSLTNVISVSAGAIHSLALLADGTVVSWPTNAFLPTGLSNIVCIAAGDLVSAALRSDGSVVWWSKWGVVAEAWTNAVSIDVGASVFALTEGGNIERWDTKAVETTYSNVVSFSAAEYMVQAIRADGTIVHSYPHPPSTLTNVLRVVQQSNRNTPGDVIALVGEPGAIAAQTMPVAKPSVTAAGFSAQVPTVSGRVYRLEYSESLLNPDWKPLSLVAGTGKTVARTDPAPLAKQRYYRVRSW